MKVDFGRYRGQVKEWTNREMAELGKVEHDLMGDLDRANARERSAAMSPFAKRSRGSSVAPSKAKEILKDDEVGGRPLTSKQKGFFGARAGGAPEKPAPRNPPGRKGRR